MLICFTKNFLFWLLSFFLVVGANDQSPMLSPSSASSLMMSPFSKSDGERDEMSVPKPTADTSGRQYFTINPPRKVKLVDTPEIIESSPSPIYADSLIRDYSSDTHSQNDFATTMHQANYYPSSREVVKESQSITNDRIAKRSQNEYEKEETPPKRPPTPLMYSDRELDEWQKQMKNDFDLLYLNLKEKEKLKQKYLKDDRSIQDLSRELNAEQMNLQPYEFDPITIKPTVKRSSSQIIYETTTSTIKQEEIKSSNITREQIPVSKSEAEKRLFWDDNLGGTTRLSNGGGIGHHNIDSLKDDIDHNNAEIDLLIREIQSGVNLSTSQDRGTSNDTKTIEDPFARYYISC